MNDNDLAPTPETPVVEVNFMGVRVALSGEAASRGPVTLFGVFQIPQDQATAIDEHPHRGLVIAISSTHGTIAGGPFRGRVFFHDDVQHSGASIRGYFRVGLVDPGEVVPEGPHWATVSLGRHLSNVVAFGGPPTPEEI
jgi:hypothetical protein